MTLRSSWSRLLWAMPVVVLGAFASVPGCAGEADPGEGREPLGSVGIELTKDQRIARYKKMKAAANARGVPNNAYLLAGIAYAETGLAHCWSEATWACKGPGSADCGGGPVISGAADGPCSIKQGGLGMFQFDAGTHDQTLAKYGKDVLTVAGNTQDAISYVVNMVKISAYTTGAGTDAKALAWVNNYDNGNKTLRDQWIKTVTHYYNGCKPSYGCWSQRYKHYNDSLGTVLGETGLAFWKSEVDTDKDGLVDAKDNCPKNANKDQKDSDKDKSGDVCDTDDDGDSVADKSDNCPTASNKDQKDSDKDKSGDACDGDDDNDKVADKSDNCPLVANKDQKDSDKDKKGDACDDDDDGDGVKDTADNCPLVANKDQKDSDG
ncbi:MAG: hypothetical protein EOO74_05175, partial [Myxococcales bacterium]